ncbi:hypothetical protein TWF730_000249 [Orbilia blumenaviensis]|uniref:DUF4246 domain-containing protein n=1 Tax=Orbilia blumenaviensis TaxID=1796055 RepID=A0AAV9VKZ3_9PEZI
MCTLTPNPGLRSPPNKASFYTHPTDNVLTTRILYREECIRKFSAFFRNDPDWVEKLDDPVYFGQKLKKAKENAEFSFTLNQAIAVWSDEDGEFAWRELREAYRPFVMKYREDGKRAEPTIDAVWKADQLVEESVQKALIEAVKTLEDVPEEENVWQRQSTGSPFLNLVHPSQWPLIYGLTTTSNGDVIQTPPMPGYIPPQPGLTQYYAPEIVNSYSVRFGWLPSEFEVSEDGKVRIASYINNLATERQQRLFYPVLEKIFEGFVPLFNHVLADLREGKPEFRRVKWDADYSPETVDDSHKDTNPEMKEKPKLATTWEDFLKDPILEQSLPTGPGQIMGRDPRERLTGGMWTPPPPEVLEDVKLEGKTAKVIVKMTHIVLTPDRRWYTGGDWRVEGLKNERTVACGVYCYQQENITEYGLSFRRGFDKDKEEEEMGFFGTESNDTCQGIGNVELMENRGVVFPNIYHNRGWACCLRDETKTGYVKLLEFLLCEPSEEFTIQTTRNVPAQQPEIRQERLHALRQACKLRGRLPPELIYEIEEHVPPSISKDEAMEYYGEIWTEGVEWTECILQMGGDASFYVRSKPTNESFDMISSPTSYLWTTFKTRY